MANKTAIIVGGTAGIGKALALLLVRGNCQVTIIGRNVTSGRQLEAQSPLIHFLPADLSLITEVKRIATIILQRYSSVDLVVHTADILRGKRETTAEGNETSFATNYLSRVLFNHLVMPLLEKTDAPQLIHIAAPGFPTKLSAKNFLPSDAASSFQAHGIGQVANDYYGANFHVIYPTSRVRIKVLNPGMVDTDIRRNGAATFHPLFRLLFGLFGWLFAAKIVPPDRYAQTAYHIIKMPAKDIFYNSKGKVMQMRRDRFDPERWHYVWQETIRKLALNQATVHA